MQYVLELATLNMFNLAHFLNIPSPINPVLYLAHAMLPGSKYCSGPSSEFIDQIPQGFYPVITIPKDDVFRQCYNLLHDTGKTMDLESNPVLRCDLGNIVRMSFGLCYLRLTEILAENGQGHLSEFGVTNNWGIITRKDVPLYEVSPANWIDEKWRGGSKHTAFGYIHQLLMDYANNSLAPVTDESPIPFEIHEPICLMPEIGKHFTLMWNHFHHRRIYLKDAFDTRIALELPSKHLKTKLALTMKHLSMVSCILTAIIVSALRDSKHPLLTKAQNRSILFGKGWQIGFASDEITQAIHNINAGWKPDDSGTLN